MQRDPANQNALSVKLELQADCYAGVWAEHAPETPTPTGSPSSSVTSRTSTRRSRPPAPVGDDTIQGGGHVDESGFTHGSSADRQKWF